MQFDSTTNSGRASIIEAHKIAVSENAGRLSFKSFCDINGIFDYEKIINTAKEEVEAILTTSSSC